MLARYAEGVLAGLPAVTRHSFGAGAAWYVSTLLSEDSLDHLLRAVAGGFSSGSVPGVAVTRRTDGSGRSWLFAFNHGDAPVTLPASGVELLSCREVAGTLELAPGDIAVIREEQLMECGGHGRTS